MHGTIAAGYPESLRVRRDPQDGRFRNLSGVEARPFRDVLRWNLGWGPREQPAIDPARVPPGAAPRVEPDLARLHSPPPDAVQFTWVGHATWLIQAGGRNILTDPIWSEHCAPVPHPRIRRRVAPGVPFTGLPRIDLVLLSHGHYDHCDVPTLRRLGAAPDYVVPLGLAPLVRRCGAARIHEAEWGEALDLGAVRLTCLPAQHFTARTGWDRNRTLWCGWLIEVADRRIYFAGDTGFAPFFTELGPWFGARGGVEVALLPVGAYQPRWFMTPVHCTAAEAVEIHRLIGARLSLAMHWGVWQLTEEPLGEPPVLLADARRAAGVRDEDFRVPAVGETVVWGG